MSETKENIIETLSPGYTFKMIFVKGGTFFMGSDTEDAYADEQPVHEVSLQSFYMGEFPVTQALWESIMNNNHSSFKMESRPVEMVSWDDSQEFIKKLNGLTMQKYRLPTEAEWEFSARGGAYTEGYKYSGSDRLKEVGWYDENSGDETHKVGEKMANELGLYEMSGNVWEWVEDLWHDHYKGAPTDGIAWIDQDTSVGRVLRGGSWANYARACRVSYRYRHSPGHRRNGFGFRLALSLQSAG